MVVQARFVHLVASGSGGCIYRFNFGAAAHARDGREMGYTGCFSCWS